ncbi:hydrogenase nickel incorporation protein HypB [Dongshaea marina]|uniref:hydrogenase nickel incorporation protein HypB n=1 Tax=Dongshaea marina TaxID=2047966 RepID=UPI001F216133|nr:hydrogenase nickel incorporation protein HypB [Dongshaea marina]
MGHSQHGDHEHHGHHHGHSHAEHAHEHHHAHGHQHSHGHHHLQGMMGLYPPIQYVIHHHHYYAANAPAAGQHAHSHAHEHGHSHSHQHGHSHSHEHGHSHSHEHGHSHSHQHGHSHSHEHGHSHSHEHGHSHSHEHGHNHSHEHGHSHSHQHDHNHSHQHAHQHSQKSQTLNVGLDVLHHNDDIAAANRAWFDKNNIRVINLMSSPGSGKTTLLQKTLERLEGKLKVAVIVGDQQTDYDAARLQNTGLPVKQINTISSCHLDASMISRELGDFVDESLDLLIIENVGNLVCPAAFDLGEHERVALLSVCEGEDKPAKYPVLFNRAGLVLLTKTDLLPHLNWDRQKCLAHIESVSPGVRCLDVASTTEKGLESWTDYLVDFAQPATGE